MTANTGSKFWTKSPFPQMKLNSDGNLYAVKQGVFCRKGISSVFYLLRTVFWQRDLFWIERRISNAQQF